MLICLKLARNLFFQERREYSPQTNESATVPKTFQFSKLNKAQLNQYISRVSVVLKVFFLQAKLELYTKIY